MESGGATILVPSERASELRLTLASQGIPKGGSVGFELLESQKLGISQFHEQVNYQRALEGELARTIQSISAVMGARVHLAIPKQTAFLRNDQKPTASVVVNLHAGRKLEAAQVAGIVHLVSSSVPELAASEVSVIDQSGTLLTGKRNPGGPALDDSQLAYIRSVEASYIARIQTILEPMVGAGNFRAQVTADVDFDATEQTSETYTPNPAPNSAIRSQQTSEALNPLPGAIGIPGALSNQPPVEATAPITAPGVAAPSPSRTSGAVNTNRSATTNYELDRTIQHVKRSIGSVRRLSVALVINNRKEMDAKGNRRAIALSAAEVSRINDLVKEAVGYDAKRGDTINVTNTAFAEVAQQEVASPPFYKDPEAMALAGQVLRWLLVLGVVVFVVAGVIRPLLRSVAPPEPEKKEDEDAAAQGPGAQAGEAGAEPEQAGMTYEMKLAHVREVAESDPRLVAQLVREWMGGTSGEAN